MVLEFGAVLLLGSGEDWFRGEVGPVAANLETIIHTPKIPTSRIAPLTSSHGKMPFLGESIVSTLMLAGWGGGTGGAGAWIVDCGGALLLAGNTSVGGAPVVRAGGMRCVCSGLYGADRSEPSARQNARVSSG
jgi:hypothetical protein